MAPAPERQPLPAHPFRARAARRLRNRAPAPGRTKPEPALLEMRSSLRRSEPGSATAPRRSHAARSRPLPSPGARRRSPACPWPAASRRHAPASAVPRATPRAAAAAPGRVRDEYRRPAHMPAQRSVPASRSRCGPARPTGPCPRAIRSPLSMHPGCEPDRATIPVATASVAPDLDRTPAATPRLRGLAAAPELAQAKADEMAQRPARARGLGRRSRFRSPAERAPRHSRRRKPAAARRERCSDSPCRRWHGFSWLAWTRRSRVTRCAGMSESGAHGDGLHHVPFPSLACSLRMPWCRASSVTTPSPLSSACSEA
jgi:hypothetical protein